ncbi:hypothetical protein ACFQY5_16680 [Paeniroseomonas aquatica]|uniref:hypothetical protein n=1 Tax=Paeniroseomonas aquatica TaxID=373043 RepID=UPI00361B941B
MAFRCTGHAAAVVAAGLLLAPPVAAQAPPGAARPQAAAEGGGRTRSQFLVHVHTGPADPTRAALALLVAATALRDGHKVDLFLAGDGVALLTPEALASVEGSAPAASARMSRRSSPAAGGSTSRACRPGPAASATSSWRAGPRNSPCRRCWCASPPPRTWC